MTNNRFLAAIKMLFGMPVARLTFPLGVTTLPSDLLFEGRGLEITGLNAEIRAA